MRRHYFSGAAPTVKFGVIAVCLASVLCGTANADQDHRRHGREFHGQERRAMYFDQRHHQAHYYPALGYSVSVLPAASVNLSFRGGRYFFNSGVWYRPLGAGFTVIRPPVGIVVPVLPPAYSTLWVGSRPYYYANDTYYVQAATGYSVVDEPTAPMLDAPSQPAPVSMPLPPAAPASTAPAQAPAVWYYCESSKTYYPYVAECREGWRTVPAAPPR